MPVDQASLARFSLTLSPTPTQVPSPMDAPVPRFGFSTTAHLQGLVATSTITL